MRREIFLLIAIALVTVGCTRTINATPNPNDIATQVDLLLTTIPSTPQFPTPLPSIPPVTATPLISASPVPISSPTPSVTPAASVPTPPPGPTATVTASDPRLALGEPTRSDKMQTGDAWGLYDNGHVKVASQSGYLALTAVNPDGWTGWTLTYPKLINFYAEATLKPEQCSGMDHYGLVFRAEDGSLAYLLGITCDGQYSFSRFDADGFTTLVDWTKNSAILAGANQTNRLGVMGKGDTFTFYANGVKLGEAKDTTLNEGELGLFIASMVTPNFTIEALQFDYWNQP